MPMNDAQKIRRRLDQLARISDEPGGITRLFGSPAMRRANELVGRWMRAAGMKTRVDAVGNLIGHYAGKTPAAKILLLGSHLDTVRRAGKFDGPLGIMLAVACVEHCQRRKIRLPYALEIIGFADEEGVRYQTACLGSQAITGHFDPRHFKRVDARGISLAAAIKQFGGNPARIKSARLDQKRLLGYVEAHIEQGPVLEKKNLALGVVTGIVGQTRVRLHFIGRAGHAGTVPMQLRRDALCAAAEFILAAENLAHKTAGLVATVGEISARPGASNVIPGEARLTLDLRHASDSLRQQAKKQLRQTAVRIATRRKLALAWEVVHETAAMACCPDLSAPLAAAVRRQQKRVPRLASGAGHDAAVMAGITPAAMLFIRCRGGISHHPDESVKTGDIGRALAVLNDFLRRLAGQHERL